VPKEPWRSIVASTVTPAEPRRLGFQEAMTSPCDTCGTAPCCVYLPLHKFPVNTMMDLDYARYLVNFDRIELGLSSDGEWRVHYRYPCRFLDRATFRCTVHDTDDQPDICKNFNPYSCWYRKSLRQPLNDGYLRIDHPRMTWIVEHSEFDDDRNLIGVPSWASMVEAFAALPYDEQRGDDEAMADEVFERWRRDVVAASPPPATPRGYAFQELADPCTDCSAFCCTALSFPHRAPVTRASVDFLRFVLGFPGIEVGIGDTGWTLIVRTRCRHLAGNRCSIFATPERPLVCRFYDAHQCAYRLQFGESRAAGFVRMRFEEFPAVASTFSFDAHGRVLHAPTAEEIRTAIETEWRSRQGGTVVHTGVDVG